jgi:hypothetical protein
MDGIQPLNIQHGITENNSFVNNHNDYSYLNTLIGENSIKFSRTFVYIINNSLSIGLNINDNIIINDLIYYITLTRIA